MSQLAGLPLAERLELVQNLWDSIDATKQSLPDASWRREILQARLAEVEHLDEPPGIDRKELWRQVDQRREA